MMMGWSGMGPSPITPEVYARFSDEYILDWLTAERDDNGMILPEYKTAERNRRKRQGEPTGEPEDVAHEIPSKEELQIPDEAFRYRVDGRMDGPPTSYILMFWSLWRQRGLNSEQTMEKWRAQMKAYNCKLY